MKSLNILLFTLVIGVLVSAWSEQRIVCGQRCLWIPSQASTDSKPPIVLIGGLAQTISSYQAHFPALTKQHNVLIYECRGQGLVEDGPIDDNYANVTLPFQAQRLLNTVDELVGTNTEYDIVGFSLGARIGMATACLFPERIHKMHLTGVATQRSPQAKVALQAWKHLSGNNNLQGFAWSALQTTYSSNFLLQNQHRLSSWIEFLCESNSCNGISALLQQTHPESRNDPWHVYNMAQHISQSQKIQGRIVVGELDCMAPPQHAKELATLLKWKNDSPRLVANSGHAVPMEAGREWRNDVLQFLNE